MLTILSVIVLKGKTFAIYKGSSDRTKEEGEVSLTDFSQINNILLKRFSFWHLNSMFPVVCCGFDSEEYDG